MLIIFIWDIKGELKMKNTFLVLILLFLPVIGLSCGEKEHKDWDTYKDEVFNFSMQYPKNWEVQFWKYGKDVESLRSQKFGHLADHPNELLINFNVYKADKGKSLNDFVKNSVDKHDQIYFRYTKKLGKVNAIRFGAHLYLREGEIYELRQSMKIGEYFIDLSADLSKDSMEKKDDKYKLIIEIMDTFKKL